MKLKDTIFGAKDFCNTTDIYGRKRFYNYEQYINKWLNGKPFEFCGKTVRILHRSLRVPHNGSLYHRYYCDEGTVIITIDEFTGRS